MCYMPNSQFFSLMFFVLHLRTEHSTYLILSFFLLGGKLKHKNIKRVNFTAVCPAKVAGQLHKISIIFFF